jgi:hypothetical protein
MKLKTRMQPMEVGRRCENNFNILVDLKEIRNEVVDWIHLASGRAQW